jgi:hypothetical protein
MNSFFRAAQTDDGVHAHERLLSSVADRTALTPPKPGHPIDNATPSAKGARQPLAEAIAGRAPVRSLKQSSRH